jgi:hypothetical protein
VSPEEASHMIWLASRMRTALIRPSSRLLIHDSPEVVTKRRFLRPKNDPNRAAKRSRSAVQLDSNETSTTNRNMLLPINTFLKFLENNICCKRFVTLFSKQNVVNDEGSTNASEAVQVLHNVLCLEVFGLACGLNFNCECGASASLRPDLVPAAAKTKTNLWSKECRTQLGSTPVILKLTDDWSYHYYSCVETDSMMQKTLLEY